MDKKILFLSMAVSLAMTACDDKDEPYIATEPDPEVVITREMADSVWSEYMGKDIPTWTKAAIPTAETEAYYEDYIENWLTEDEETRDVEITFTDDTATCKFLDDSKKTPKYVKITAKGAHVTIHNDSIENGEAAGRARMNYILKGSSQHASLRIYSNKKFMVSLRDVCLHNDRGSVINAQKAMEKKRMFIKVEEGTQNTLWDAVQYSDTIAGEDDKGAIFSEGKLIITGKGELKVKGNYNHAIACDDRIHIMGDVILDIEDAAKDGLHAKDEIVISGGWVRSMAQKDAVQSDSLLLMRGGCLMAAGKRAVSAPNFDYQAGKFCLFGNSTQAPTTAALPCDSILGKGYTVIIAK